MTSPHIYMSIDTNTSMSNFYFKIEQLLDEMAPVKKLTKKEIGLQQRPWITPDIISTINERNKLYKEFIEEKILILKLINTTHIKQTETLSLLD